MLNKLNKQPFVKVIFSFFVLIFFCSCSNDEKGLVGKWESANRTHDMGNVITFMRDSSVILVTNVLINYDYRLEGDKLISTSVESHSGRTIIDTATVEFKDDTMIIRRAHHGGETTILTREENNGNGIVGKWSWLHKTGKTAFTEYSEDGKAKAYVTVKSLQGKYEVNGDSLTMIFPGTTYRNVIFELKDDSLYVESKDGSMNFAYKRIY